MSIIGTVAERCSEFASNRLRDYSLGDVSTLVLMKCVSVRLHWIAVASNVLVLGILTS